MEGNDIEISVDVDFSRLILKSYPELNDGPTILFPPRQHELYNSNIKDAEAGSGSNSIRNYLHFSSAKTSSIMGGEKMAPETQNKQAAMVHLLKSKKSHSSPFWLQDINTHLSHNRKMGQVAPWQQHEFFSSPETLPNSPTPTKGLPATIQEAFGHTLHNTDKEQTIANTFNTTQPELMTSNFSTISLSATTGATNNIFENWSLPSASILNTQVNESGHHQNLATTDWSGEEIGAVSIIALMVPFIICSNLLVILSIVRFRRLQIPTNSFITSLASVDVLVALATPFMIMVEVFQFGVPGGSESDGNSGAFLCLLPNRILIMACSVSLLTLATIAYDRHTALVSPLDYVVIMTSRRVRFLVSLTWIYSVLVVWFPLLVGWYDNPTKSIQCSADLLHGKAHALFLSAIFLPSCGVILVCYARIFSLARHHAQAIAAVEFSVNRQVKFIMKDAKYAKTLALVIGVFLTLWLPYLVSVFVKVVAGVTLSIWVQTYLVLVAVLNSGINPWIYAFKNKEFRHAFRRLYHEVFLERLCLRRFSRRRKMSSAQTSGYSSSTPRLSRSDSHTLTAVTVDSVTLDNVWEKLQRSLDSLDRFDKYQDQRLGGQCRAWRSGPLPGSFRAMPTVATKLKRYRQAVSCANLKDTEEVTAILPRSLSVEFFFQGNEDGLGNELAQTEPIIMNDKQVLQTNLTIPALRQDDINTINTNSSPYTSTPSARYQYGSASNVMFKSLPVTDVSSSLLATDQQVRTINEEDNSTFSLFDHHKNGTNSDSQSNIAGRDYSITASNNCYTKGSETFETLPRDDTAGVSNNMNTCFSQESMSPRCPSFSTVVFESHSQLPTSNLCSEPSLSHFPRTDLCRGFYPEPSSLTSSGFHNCNLRVL